MQLEMFPEIRYTHDSDELILLADWLNERKDILTRFDRVGGATKADIAFDYFRLADQLDTLAIQAREFARANYTPIP